MENRVTGTITAEGRLIRSRLVTALVIVVMVGVLLVLADAIGGRGVVPGQPGDSTATTARGAAALRVMMEERDLIVERSGGPLDDVDRLSTIVLLEPGTLSTTLSLRLPELRSHIDRGGMVVLGGNVPEAFIEDLSGLEIETRAASGSRQSLVSSIGGVSGELVGEGTRTFRVDGADAEEWVVLAGTAEETVAVAAEISGGVLVVVADIGPFTNSLIDEGSNAVFLASLLGRHPTVVFDDFVHGYRQPIDGIQPGSWFAALPAQIQSTLRLMGIVLALWMITYGRRLGPPESMERRLPPARSEHIRSVAGALGRSGRPLEAIEPTRQEVLTRLAAKIGPVDGVDRQSLENAARSAGLSESQIQVVLNGPTNMSDVLAIDHALATITAQSRPLAAIGSNVARRETV